MAIWDVNLTRNARDIDSCNCHSSFERLWVTVTISHPIWRFYCTSSVENELPWVLLCHPIPLFCNRPLFTVGLFPIEPTLFFLDWAGPCNCSSIYHDAPSHTKIGYATKHIIPYDPNSLWNWTDWQRKKLFPCLCLCHAFLCSPDQGDCVLRSSNGE